MADTSHLPATKAQYAALEKRGVSGVRNLTRGDVKHIHDSASEISYYIRGVWYAVRTSRSHHLNDVIYESLSYEIAMDSLFARALIELKREDDRKTDAAYQSAVAQGDTDYTWWDYREDPERNEWFGLVEKMLRERIKKTDPYRSA